MENGNGLKWLYFVKIKTYSSETKICILFVVFSNALITILMQIQAAFYSKNRYVTLFYSIYVKCNIFLLFIN